ncbi:hypothetical protein D3C72_1543950 [compost metagenome]
MDIGQALFGAAFLPGKVGRQVEFTGAPRDDGAATDAHQPFIVADILPRLALRRHQGTADTVEFTEDGVQGFRFHVRIAAVTEQALALALEFLQQVGLQVGATRHFEHIENSCQGNMVLHCMLLLDEELEFVVQVFQPQQGTYAFVERVFVDNQNNSLK